MNGNNKTLIFVGKNFYYTMIRSTLTDKVNTRIVNTIPSSKVIALYKNALDIDTTDYFKGVNEISIVECLDSTFRFYYPDSIFGDGAFYSLLNSKNSGYYKPDRWEHLTALTYLQKNDHVLEVGTGDGAFLVLAKARGIAAVGLELNTEAVKTATAKGCNVLPELLDVHAQNHSHTYDVVVSFQVLEHIYDVKSYFNDAIKCLKPNGRLIIGVPNNNPYIFKRDDLHVLNLPPHHSGLWSQKAFQQVPHFFPLTLQTLQIEPLQEYKEWYIAQKNYYRKRRPIIGCLMSLVPAFIYKRMVKLFAGFIDGRNLLVVFKKQ